MTQQYSVAVLFIEILVFIIAFFKKEWKKSSKILKFGIFLIAKIVSFEKIME